MSRTALDNPALAASLIQLHKAGRITTELLVDGINDLKLARKIVKHEVLHDLITLQIYPVKGDKT